MVVIEKNYINSGSTALQPKRKPIEKDNSELKRAENEKQRHKKQLKLKNQGLVILSIVLLFSLGSTLIYRYSEIYAMENTLIKSTSNSGNIEKDNENLRLQLVQHNRVSVVEDNAAKLNMVPIDKSQEVSLNYDKQTLTASENSDDTKDKQSFFNKIIAAITNK
ncbi:hypothetical protein [Clostridium akagii]|uniref:hypothetical protein n=1 Tax=Clostridium akagii TaxID=91623 RepID=UPI00047A9327|nr:hypothetical protein [Clostridium akagii]